MDIFQSTININMIKDKNEVLNFYSNHDEYKEEINELKKISVSKLNKGFQVWVPDISDHMINKLRRIIAYSNENNNTAQFIITSFINCGLDETTKQKCFTGIANMIKKDIKKVFYILNLCMLATQKLEEDDLKNKWEEFSNSGYDFLKLL